MHARICMLMETNRNILVQHSDSRLRSAGVLATKDVQGRLTLSPNSKVSCPGVQLLAECAKDMTVEGYFTGAHEVEVGVFSSQHHRQFIVCYRGSEELQRKPVRNGEGMAFFPSDHHQIPIHKPLNENYFADHLEERVFALLNQISNDHPFCDVVFTGYSFGAALATIAAVRYAEALPMMRVSCHLFGSPIVGQCEFRNLANSLPNLKIMRVENGSDPFVYFPGGNQWTHVGHTIAVNGEPASANKSEKLVTVRAHRFDSSNPRSSAKLRIILGKLPKKMKKDHEMQSYLESLDRFVKWNLPWVDDFDGDGDGIPVKDVTTGSVEERRYVV